MALESIRDQLGESSMGKGVAGFVAVVLLFIGILGFIWDSEPDSFSVQQNAAEILEGTGYEVVTGAVTTAALIKVAQVMLEKDGVITGGFLSNDRLPPGIFMDNVPNWEYGVLIQVRDLAKAMRETLSRSQSQSSEDPDLAIAEPRFNFERGSWAFPATESVYREGIDATRAYLMRLVDPSISNAQFYARADNLRYWLNSVEHRLGSMSQRLSASVGRKRINTDLAGDSAASQSTYSPGEIEVKTPWTEIDDIFYEARGTCWALVHFLKAVEVDFKEILMKKNALVSLQQIIRELEATQEYVYSPVILNGSGLGFLANHSLVMASYISRANAAIIDLRDLLSKG